MNPIQQFNVETQDRIRQLGGDSDLQAFSRIWIREITPHKWAYNFFMDGAASHPVSK